MAEGPIELIRLEGIDTSVALQINGTRLVQNHQVTGDMRVEEPEALVGEFVVDTPFVRGRLGTTIFVDELWGWRDALDGLDAGHDIAWCENTRRPELSIERDVADNRAYVTIKDVSMSFTTVTVSVLMLDSWFDDAYERLDLVMKTWPLAKD